MPFDFKNDACGENYVLLKGDCLQRMKDLPDNSVDLILTDPPYFRVLNEPWDRQWDDSGKFLAWIGSLADEWRRILKPNGSLYCFASPRMAGRVEVEIGKRFNVLNSIVWDKQGNSTSARACKEALRSFSDSTERIVFAEHYGSDNMAKGEAGYVAKCDELRGFVFEPIRKYLDDERIAAGFSVRDVAEAFQKKTGSRTVTGMAGHWFGVVQWMPPTSENYAWLRGLFNSKPGSDYLKKEYDYLKKEYDELKKEYDELKKEYEALRRPFSVTKEVPYTGVWRFGRTKTKKGRHPCEKPQDLLKHIITASSRPGAVVLDCFTGSGSAGSACLDTGRLFVGIEMCDNWFAVSEERLANDSKNPPPSCQP